MATRKGKYMAYSRNVVIGRKLALEYNTEQGISDHDRVFVSELFGWLEERALNKSKRSPSLDDVRATIIRFTPLKTVVVHQNRLCDEVVAIQKATNA